MARIKSYKIMQIAADADFRARVRLLLVFFASGRVDEENGPRATYAREVLAGRFNLDAATIAVVAQPIVGDNLVLPAEGEPPVEDNGVTDAKILEAISGGADVKNGVFHKLAVASAK